MPSWMIIQGQGKGNNKGCRCDKFGAESYGYEAPAKDWSRMIFHDLTNTVGRKRRVPWTSSFALSAPAELLLE